MRDDAILLIDWGWITLEYRVRRPALPAVWVFRSRVAADRARRTYGRGAWRAMNIEFVGR